MAIKTAWYICPYKREKAFPPSKYSRYCAMCDYSKNIKIDGGGWAETEVLGNRAIVKVKAEEATLIILDGVFKRIPKDSLADSLADLSPTIKQALKNEILDMGYTVQEIQDRLPNDIGTYTLKDILKFMTIKRRAPRFVEAIDDVIFDGAESQCISITDIDKKVR